MTKKQLFLDRFKEEYKKGILYYSVAVTTPNTKNKEVITNSKANILSKIEYWDKAYNDDLELVTNTNIKIVDYIATSNIDFLNKYMGYWFEYKR